ncbi:MAG: GTP-binding protein, partial [Bacteroidota bacterium]
GKTTYLNHLMKSNPDTRYAIIENEYGEQSIDSELIIRGEDDIVELNNGCLCCTLNDNLYDILNTLFERRAEYDEIVIEATGVANPAGLAEPFVAHSAIKKQFPLKGIICLVDAEQIEQQLEATKEAMEQVTFSDVLLINKTDLVASDTLDALQDKLKRLNPLARILTKTTEGFPEVHHATYSVAFEETLQKTHGLRQLSNSTQTFPVHQPHHHHHHHEHTEVVSHTIIIDQAFDKQKLYHQLLVYLTFQAADLYRMKGLVWIANEEEQFVIQSVGKRLDLEQKSPWKPHEEKRSTLVFIGKGIQRAGLEKLLKKCLH